MLTHRAISSQKSKSPKKKLSPNILSLLFTLFFFFSLSLPFSLSKFMDATKWTQGFQEMINVKPMEQIISNTNNNTSQQQPTFIATNTRPNTTTSNGGSDGNNNNMATIETRKARPLEKVNCPRCNSTNTKFCYYNNYSLTQPRYFCKGCRRYWTEGGSLRNVPVGGSSRKNKRSSTPLASTSNPKLPDLNPPLLFSNQISNKSKDLSLLSFPVMQDHHHSMSQFLRMPKIENNNTASTIFDSSSSVSALELLRSNGVSSRGMNTFLPGQIMDSNSVLYSSLGFPTMPDYKQGNNNLSFSIDNHQGIGHNTFNSNQRADDNNNNDDMNGASRVLFPFPDMKELSSTTQEKSHGNNTYWSGMFSNTGGSSW